MIEPPTEFSIRLSVPQGATMEDVQAFGREILDSAEKWHKQFEPDTESVDLTNENP